MLHENIDATDMNEEEAMDILIEWNELQKKLKKLNQQEQELREKLAVYTLNGKTEGSKTSRIADVKVRATAPMYYNVDKAAYAIYKEDLSEEDWQALEFKPSIKPAVFKKLDNDSLLRQITTATPGRKQFTIVEDKV